MNNEFNSIASKLQSLEESLMSIILEATVKISKLTDNNIFILIETPSKSRKICGDESLVRDFQSLRLLPRPDDSEFTLEKPSLCQKCSSVDDSLTVCPTRIERDFNTDFQNNLNNRKRKTEDVAQPVTPKLVKMESVSMTITDHDVVNEVNESVADDNDIFDLENAQNVGIVCRSTTLPSKFPEIYEKDGFALDGNLVRQIVEEHITTSKKGQALLSNEFDLTIAGVKGLKETSVLSSLLWDIAKHFVFEIKKYVIVPNDRSFWSSAADCLIDVVFMIFPGLAYKNKSDWRQRLYCYVKKIQNTRKSFQVDGLFGAN